MASKTKLQNLENKSKEFSKLLESQDNRIMYMVHKAANGNQDSMVLIMGLIKLGVEYRKSRMYRLKRFIKRGIAWIKQLVK